MKITIATYCSHCRSHIEVLLRCPTPFGSESACPNSRYPLHHWLHSPFLSTPRSQSNVHGQYEWIDKQAFECSAPQCMAALIITTRPPRLDPQDVFILTDRATIRERAQAYECEDGEEVDIPEPVNVLTNLKAYINNALTDTAPRRIPSGNKRFATTLGGSACSLLLKRLGFRYDAETEYWDPPEFQSPIDTPFEDERRLVLDDVNVELLELLSARPWAETSKAKITPTRPVEAFKDLETALGCLDFSKRVSSLRSVDYTRDEHPYYASLGALADFSDQLLEFAYDRQKDTDPLNAPYYFECLVDIAKGRQSTDLDTRVAMLRSSGVYSVQDVHSAYKYFNLTSQNLPDEFIIGCFRSRIQDSPRQEVEAREMLRIIGHSRNSDQILQVASNSEYL
jgi:ubiquitin carboxyl-terminal hydrolase 25/28